MQSTKNDIKKVLVSNNTISRRILHIAEDLHDQLIEEIKGKEFDVQLYDATSSNKHAHIFTYAFWMILLLKVFFSV